MSDRGDMLAANVRSFLSSARYSAPENLPFLIDQKLARPLAEYNERRPFTGGMGSLLLFEDGLAEPVACLDREGRLTDPDLKPYPGVGLPKILFADVPTMLHLTCGIMLSPMGNASPGTAGR